MLLKNLPDDLFLHVVSLLEDTDRRGLCGWCTRLGAEAASASASAAARRRCSPPERAAAQQRVAGSGVVLTI